MLMSPEKSLNPYGHLCGFIWGGIIPESSLQTIDVDVLASLQFMSSQSKKLQHKQNEI